MFDDSLESKGRRNFLKSSAQVAVTAPAVSMLLAGGTKSAMAQKPYGGDAPICDLEDLESDVSDCRSGPA
jgi:hypothetical protein